ncbi:MAG: cupin domain-containing protein [Phycisphaerae bacterium]|nr:cupin domain-containing protein [Phycisphaerae bacterium]
MNHPSSTPVLRLFGETIRILVPGRQTRGAFALIEEITPIGSGPPLHRHKDEDEWFSVLEGRIEIQLDGKRSEAGPGEMLFAPRRSVHTFRSIGDVPLKTHIVVSPPRLDEFFLDVAKVWIDGPPPEPIIASLFAKHGLELLGPPIGISPDPSRTT